VYAPIDPRSICELITISKPVIKFPSAKAAPRTGLVARRRRRRRPLTLDYASACCARAVWRARSPPSSSTIVTTTVLHTEDPANCSSRLPRVFSDISSSDDLPGALRRRARGGYRACPRPSVHCRGMIEACYRVCCPDGSRNGVRTAAAVSGHYAGETALPISWWKQCRKHPCPVRVRVVCGPTCGGGGSEAL